MKIYLIRHGKTEGNLTGRYVGVTDESLCGKGMSDLEKVRDRYADLAPQKIFVTARKRTRETAEILFPGRSAEVISGLSECDFGEFENKNYKELDGNKNYQRWIDSGGMLPFPGGESRGEFTERCKSAFISCVNRLLKDGTESAAFVVHGGTIMAVLSQLAVSPKTYYDWQIGNGEGFVMETDENRLAEKEKFLVGIRRIE